VLSSESCGTHNGDENDEREAPHDPEEPLSGRSWLDVVFDGVYKDEDAGDAGGEEELRDDDEEDLADKAGTDLLVGELGGEVGCLSCLGVVIEGAWGWWFGLFVGKW